MQKLPDFVPALSHHLKPLVRDGSQFTRMLFHPRIDGGIPLDSAIESQQFRPLHGFSIYHQRIHLRSRLSSFIGAFWQVLANNILSNGEV
jgi:hypothetical protein